jgi:colicin import membrane protein
MSTENNDWKIPFNFAIGLHLAVIISAVYLPQLLHTKPMFPDIYTVDLINISAPEIPRVQTVSPPSPAPKQDKIKEIKEVPAKAVSIPEKSAPAAPAEIQSKPISIKPLNKKVVKTVAPQPIVPPQKKLQELHKKNLEEAREAEKIAQEAARIAAMEAVTNLKQMLQESESYAKSNQPVSEKQQTQPTRRSVNNVVESQYYTSISNKLHAYWALPEYKSWDPALDAVIVIQIEKDGTISDQFFEKKSGDRLFDQFVLKTLKDASPLPAIPAALQVDKIEIGIRFLPGGIQF